MKKNDNISFNFSLHEIDSTVVSILLGTFFVGLEKHPNPIFKRLALLFLEEMRSRLEQKQSPLHTLAFDQFNTNDLIQAMAGMTAVKFKVEQENHERVLDFCRGLLEACFAEIQKRDGGSTQAVDFLQGMFRQTIGRG